MCKMLIFVLLSTLLVFAQGEEGVPVLECPTKGFSCSSDCKTVNYCPDTNATSYVVDDCTTVQKYCNPADFTCSANACSGSENIRFNCTTGGYVPDPYHCNKYFFCSTPGKDPLSICTCSNEDYWYDTKQKGCVSGSCPRPKPTCSKAGECRSLNPILTDYYYVCVRDEDQLKPLVFSCLGTFTASSCSCSRPGRYVDSETFVGSTRDTCNVYEPPTTASTEETSTTT